MFDTRLRQDVSAAVEAGLGDTASVTPGVTRRSAPPERPAPARTPTDPTPLPEVADRHDLSRPVYYLNRELTWLNFDFRVLPEAEDPRTPMLERLKFLAIVGSNLDEFFMKRIGGLKQQVEAGITERTVDGRTGVSRSSSATPWCAPWRRGNAGRRPKSRSRWRPSAFTSSTGTI